MNTPTTTAAPALTREAWNRAYAARMMEVAKMPEKDALGCAESVDDYFNEGDDPADAADEEMSCWTD